MRHFLFLIFVFASLTSSVSALEPERMSLLDSVAFRFYCRIGVVFSQDIQGCALDEAEKFNFSFIGGQTLASPSVSQGVSPIQVIQQVIQTVIEKPVETVTYVQGPAGPQGEKGDMGDAGLPGATGGSVTSGLGTLPIWIGLGSTGGGSVGATGATGPAGANGTTTTIYVVASSTEDIDATGTITTLNLLATNATTTNLFSSNANFDNLIFGNATGTNLSLFNNFSVSGITTLSTTTFSALPTLPLSFGSLLIGNVSNFASPYAAGATGTVLSILNGTPTWVATSSLGFASTITNTLSFATSTGILTSDVNGVAATTTLSLANLPGLINLTSQVSGALAVVNGGTGTSTVPTLGQLLMGDGLGGYNLVATSSLGISTAPGGSNTQIQYNNGGVLAGATGFTFNNAIGDVNIGNANFNPATYGSGGANSQMTMLFGGGGVAFWNYSLGFSMANSLPLNLSTNGVNSAPNVSLFPDAADTLALRRSTNAQTFRVYNTFTSSTNYERGVLQWDTNVLEIGTEKGSGGGTARGLALQTDATTRLAIASTGAITFNGAYTFPTTDGFANQVLQTNGAGVLSFATSTTLPAGSDTQVQFNDGGALGGDAGLIFDKTSNQLTITGGGLTSADGVLANAASSGGWAGVGLGNFNLGSSVVFGWTSGGASGSKDTAMARNAAGVIEVNNGTAGTLRDLTARNLTANNLIQSTKNGAQAIGVLVSGQNFVGIGRNSSVGGMNFYDGTQATPSDINAAGTWTGGKLTLGSTQVVGWSSGATTAAVDIGFSRNAADVLEINNGTTGAYRDLLARKLSAISTSTEQLRLSYDATHYVANTVNSSGHILVNPNAVLAGDVNVFTIKPTNIGGVGGYYPFVVQDHSGTNLMRVSGTGALTAISINPTGGTLNSSGNTTFNITSSLGAGAGPGMVFNNSSGVHTTAFKFQDNSADLLTILGSGNVGIGTTTPWGKLSASSTSAYPALAIQQNSSGPAAIFLGGNVGIGTTTPAATLGIAGNIFASSTATSTFQGNGINLANGGCFAIAGVCVGGGSSITGSDTEVIFFDGANNPAGDANLTYNKTTDKLIFGGAVTGGQIYGAVSGASVGGLFLGRIDTGSNVFIGYSSKYELVSGSDGYIGWSATASNGDFRLMDTGLYRNAAGVVEINNGTAGTFRDLKLRNLKITTDILDTNDNELIKFTATGSAVNELTLANAATGANPTFSASGGDTDVGFDFTPKGLGAFGIRGNSTQAGTLRFFEDTDDGSNYTSFKVGTQAGNIDYTLPTADGSSGQVLSTNGSGILSWAASGGAPAGSTTQLQFNNAGAFGATSTLVWDNSAAGRLGIGTTSPMSVFAINNRRPVVTLRDNFSTQTWQMRLGASTLGNTDFDIFSLTTNQVALNVKTDGNIAIGSSTIPANNSRLFVYGGSVGANIDVRGDPGVSDQAVIELEGSDYDTTPNSVRLQYYGPNGVGTTAGFNNQRLGMLAFQGADNAIIGTIDTKPLIFFTDFAEKMRLTETGSVGIGTTTPATKLQVIGDVRVGDTGTNGCVQRFDGAALAGTCTSDQNLKKDVVYLDNILGKVTALKPSTYSWNEVAVNKYKYVANTAITGLIAQDVETVFPHLVSVNSDGFKVVDSQPLVYYTLEAIRELNAKLGDLSIETNDITQFSASLIWKKMALTFESLGVKISQGLVSFKDIVAEKFTAKEVKTEMLCVGNTCVTETEFMRLLQNTGVAGANTPIVQIQEPLDSMGTQENQGAVNEVATSTNTTTTSTASTTETVLPAPETEVSIEPTVEVVEPIVTEEIAPTTSESSVVEEPIPVVAPSEEVVD